MHLSEPAIDRFIPNQTRTNPPRIYISRPVTQVYFPPPLNFSKSRRIRILSRSRACRARAHAREFASVDFLQPLENSRAAREFSGNLPENSFTGSGHWIKNSGSSDETRRNSRSFPYMYESSALSELETFCSFLQCMICE